MDDDPREAGADPGEEEYEPDLVLEAVGRVASLDTMLEHFLSGLYATLLGNPLAEVVARGQSFETLANAIEALLREMPTHPLHYSLLEVVEAARNRHKQRNAVVHSLWFGVAGMPDRGEAMRFRRWRRESDHRVWTVAELRELAEGLLEVSWRVYDLQREYLGGDDGV